MNTTWSSDRSEGEELIAITLKPAPPLIMSKLIIRTKDAPRRAAWWQRFFRLKVKTPSFSVQFPSRCPHCMGPPEREVAAWQKRVTGARVSASSGLAPKEEHLRFFIPVCGAVREPVWQQLLTIVMGFLALTIGPLSAFQGSWLGGGIAIGAALLAWRAWRAQRWVRFVWFDEDHYVFAARRRDWLESFAEANRGRPELEVELR